MDLGRYETAKMIGQSGVAAVWSAHVRGESGTPKFAIKLIEPPAGVWSDEERRRRLALFSERTRLQASLAKPGGHWAPIHESGASHDGAWYATDLYPHSAETILHNRAIRLQSTGLHRIVTGVVKGLKEIQEVAGRTHGNVVPGNVLLAGPRAGHSHVYLADPTPDPARAKELGVAGDLRGVGALIHALVLHELPDESHKIVAVPATPAWVALGPDGEAWRILCVRLLGGAPPISTLDELEAALSKLGISRTPRTVGIITVLLLLIGGGSFAWYWTHREKCVFDQPAWNALCDMYSGWFGTFNDKLDDSTAGPSLRELCQSDPTLKVLVDKFTADRPRDPHLIAGDAGASLESLKAKPPSGARTCKGIEQTRAALTLAKASSDAFSPTQWALVSTLKKASTGKKASKLEFFTGLSSASAQLGAIDAPGQGAGQGEKIVKALRTLLDAKDTIRQVKKIEVNLELLDASEDKTLLRISQIIGKQFDFAMGNPALQKSEVPKLQKISDELTSISEDWEFEGRKINTESFHRDHPMEQGTSLDDLATAWLTDVKKYAELVENEDPRKKDKALDALKARAAVATTRSTKIVNELKINAGLVDEQDLLKKRAADLQPLFTRLEGDKFSKDLPALNEDMAALAKGVAAWEADVQRIGPLAAKRQEEWQEEVRKQVVILPSAPQQINAAWVKQRDAVLSSNQTYAEKFAAIQALKTFFTETLGAPFEAGLQIVASEAARWSKRPWHTGVQTLARTRRDEGMIAALKSYGAPGSQAVVLEDVKKEQNNFKTWATKTVEIATATDGLESALDRGYLPAESTPGEPATLHSRYDAWRAATKDLGLTLVMQSVSNRMGTVLAVAQPATPPEAVEAAALSNELSVARAAWQQMGKPTTRPLAIDFKDTEHLAKLIAGLPDTEADRKRAMTQAVADDARTRWKLRLQAAPTTQSVAEAVALTGQLNTSEADLQDTPPAHFNWKLGRFRDLAFDEGKLKEDVDVKTAITGFEDEVRKITPLAATPRVQELLQRMEKLKDTTGAPDLNKVGPPQEDWDRPAKVVGDVLVFTQKRPPAGSPPLTLTFIQLPKTNKYLLATEVPVQLFAVVDEASGHTLQTNLEPMAQTEGVRTWTIDAAKTVGPNPGWFAQDLNVAKDARFFQPVPNCTALSPMNHISPTAATLCAERLRCRVPTTQEWKMGYEIERSYPSVVWNLRDKTWVAQQDFLRKRIAAATAIGEKAPPIPWANDHIFLWPPDPAKFISIGALRNRKKDFIEPDNPWYGSGTRIEKDASAQGIYDDGQLLFTEVTYAFNRAGKPRLCDLVGNVAEIVQDQPGGNYFVMGGSAFSAANPVDVPEAAARPKTPIAAKGWSDVGFRLALEGARPLIAQLQDELHDPPYETTAAIGH